MLCVGAGGLGSPLTLYLAAAGVGTLGLVEFDDGRSQQYPAPDTLLPLPTSADQNSMPRASGCAQLNPDIRSGAARAAPDARQRHGLSSRRYDIVVDGSDNFPTRYLVNDAAVLAGKPNVHASIFRFEGQVSVFDAARGPCYSCLFPEPPPAALVPSCAEGGVLGVLPGIIGSLQALEVIKLILGCGEPLISRLLLFNALPMTFQELAIAKDRGCPVCGDAPSIQAPIDYEDSPRRRRAARGTGSYRQVSVGSVRCTVPAVTHQC